MNVASARLKVQERVQQINNGIDPDATKQVDYRKKHGETLGDIIESYFDQHLRRFGQKHRQEFVGLVAPWLREVPKDLRKAASLKQRLTIGAELKNTMAQDITPSDISGFIDRIPSHNVANKTLSHLKSLFNWTIRMQILDMRNPCDPLRNRKILKKRRDYSPEDVRMIAHHVFNPPARELVNLEGLTGKEKRIAALKAGRVTTEHEQLVEFCAYMGILFLTMARPIEVKTARFDHFDLRQLVWHKHNTKGIKLSSATYEYAYRTVPIHQRVADLVRAQRARWPDSDLLFPNHADPTRPRDNFKRSLATFKALDGVPSQFQLYDLKRIAISLMITGQGVRREDVSHYVDHRGNINTTMIYDLGFVDPLRPVTEKLGQVLGV